MSLRGTRRRSNLFFSSSFFNTISALFCYFSSSGKILYITSPFLARPSFSRANFSR